MEEGFDLGGVEFEAFFYYLFVEGVGGGVQAGLFFLFGEVLVEVFEIEEEHVAVEGLGVVVEGGFGTEGAVEEFGVLFFDDLYSVFVDFLDVEGLGFFLGPVEVGFGDVEEEAFLFFGGELVFEFGALVVEEVFVIFDEVGEILGGVGLEGGELGVVFLVEGGEGVFDEGVGEGVDGGGCGLVVCRGGGGGEVEGVIVEGLGDGVDGGIEGGLTGFEVGDFQHDISFQWVKNNGTVSYFYPCSR